MSQKDFDEVANVLYEELLNAKSSIHQEWLKTIALTLATGFSKNHRFFDKAKFLKACGIDYME